MSDKRFKKFKKYRHCLENFLFQGLSLLVKLCPFRLGLWFGKMLAIGSYNLLKSRKRITDDNIIQAKSKGFLANVPASAELARRVWAHLGMVGSEFLYYYANPHQILEAVTIEGEENLQKILAKKKGGILVSAHIGNWELMGSFLALKGYPVNPIVKVQDNPIFDKIIEKHRQTVGMKLISKTGFLRPIIKAFRNNELVSFMTDQTDRRGMEIPFFGRKAYFPRGAAEFALKTGTPMIFLYIVRENRFKHTIYVSEEIEVTETGDYTQDLQTLTTRLVGMIQTAIETHPEQWLWMHRLWK